MSENFSDPLSKQSNGCSVRPKKRLTITHPPRSSSNNSVDSCSSKTSSNYSGESPYVKSYSPLSSEASSPASYCLNNFQGQYKYRQDYTTKQISSGISSENFPSFGCSTSSNYSRKNSNSNTYLSNSSYSSDSSDNYNYSSSIDETKSKPSSGFFTNSNSSQYSYDGDNSPVIQYAERPNFGSHGRVISLKTNFFEITFARAPIVMQYHVEITFSGTRNLERDENRNIFWKAVEEHPEIFPNKFGLAYDGNHQLYVAGKINMKDDTHHQCILVDVSIWKDSRPSITFVVNITWCGPVLLDLKKDYTAVDQHRPVTPIQIIDIIFKQSLTCPFLDQSSNFYCWKSSAYRMPVNGADALSIGGAKQVWTGFFSAALVALGYRALLNVDIDYTVFYKPKISILQFLCDVLNEKYGSTNYHSRNNNSKYSSNIIHRNRGSYCDSYPNYNKFEEMSIPSLMRSGQEPWSIENLREVTRLTESEFKVFDDAIRGLKIRVRSKDGHQRVYRVNGTKGSADQLTFLIRINERDEKTSVADYFQKKYGSLKYPYLPCLHVGPYHRNTYFPLEVCYLEDHQKYTKKLSEKHTAAIIKAAAVDAQQREDRIQTLFKDACFENDPFLKNFGLSIAPKMVEATGRVIDPPGIQYGPNINPNIDTKVFPVDGAWSMDNQTLYLPASCESYALMALIPPKDEHILQNFSINLAQKAQQMGMKFPDWPDVVKYGKALPLEIKMLYREISEYYVHSGKNCNLVIIVLPCKNADVYMTIKENSDVCYGVMSQCILYKNVSRLSPATLGNLILKLNLKLGGINAAITPNHINDKYLVNQPTLVIGIDVTHPTQVEMKNHVPSVAAVVGNIDMYPQTFAATVIVQKKCRQEVVDLVQAMILRIQHFKECTGMRPKRILVYRDGVSEGQFQEVMKKEMVGIRHACRLIDPNYNPPITYIVVQKRHHARMFCKYLNDAVGKAKNIPPGTTVDTGITSSEGFDFYLCSHFGIQGTSRPAHYHVLWDDSKFTSDEIQTLSYYLCHNFGRCNRSVSIPTPVYYADLVCTRSRLHVKRALGVLETDNEYDDGSPSGIHLPHRKELFKNLGEKSFYRAFSKNDLDTLLQKCVQVVDVLQNKMYFL
uniref:Protein argonaute-2 (inferred by orthology to a D. melanogaster protein) n=1 Tax=Strongyloides venezuelensis TaxID=75913 RepID=A0A0K0F993_STRVS